MKIVSRLGRILFSIYAAIIFGSSFFIVVPCYFLVFNLFPKLKAAHKAHRVSQVWAKWTYRFLFIRVKITNKHLIDPVRTYVFISNHLSTLDIPLFALSCKNTFRFLSKAELTKVPVLGYIIKNLYITVDRGDRGDRSLSIKKMRQSIDEGVSVFLCPEGTRNQTKELVLPFKDGAFRLAVETGTPMAILTVFNSNKLLNPARWFELSPGIIYGTWSEPVETKGLNESDIEKLKVETRNKMVNAFHSYFNK